MRGRFITFEGSEGGGKSTQIQRLAARLRGMGCTVITTREPGGTPIGEEIRQLLQFSKAGHAMQPEAELLLFAASRAQLVREVIAPALEAGTIVLADRFFDSTPVYQGVARRLDPERVRWINAFAVGSVVPDRTVVLDLDRATAWQRMAARQPESAAPDRMESQPEAFYEAVRAGYLALAHAEPQRVRVIDAAPAAAAVEQAIWETLEELFHGIHAAGRF